MAINRRAPRRESGNHSHLFSTTVQVLIENTTVERIRELAEREGLTAASMAGRLIVEALAARSNPTRPAADVSPDIAPRRDGKRSPAEASSATRPQATARRRDVL